MKEIKPITEENKYIKVEKTEEPKSLIEQLKELKDFKDEVMNGNIKRKKIKIPRNAKVRKRNLKKGYVGVLKVDENGNISGEKQRISGFCFNTKDGYYHASDGREILFFDGKFPVVIQPTWRNNPLMIKKDSEEKNETYGQPYIKAKMLRDVIKVKSQNGSMIIWIIIGIVVLYGAYYLLTGGAV